MLDEGLAAVFASGDFVDGFESKINVVLVHFAVLDVSEEIGNIRHDLVMADESHAEEEEVFDPFDPSQVDLSGLANAKKED